MLLCNVPAEDRRTIFTEIERQKHISASAVEKDWFQFFRLSFLLPYRPSHNFPS
ncbi:hypothetical protein Spico_1143 [Parasphaerochaeta coccoides DSM 17374]|uniref:Uncharacterized protein n=1 Tax=Parasphaerochaeta coccoides (strain ATCC BAA-1237 / DSM 17374 / SPN1) TaxID=760011 RepID=F4GL20_PARC1|nr:hypothetical protein Spico_1143 [Parasphaerochaeta coccoides DSM 17374]